MPVIVLLADSTAEIIEADLDGGSSLSRVIFVVSGTIDTSRVEVGSGKCVASTLFARAGKLTAVLLRASTIALIVGPSCLRNAIIT